MTARVLAIALLLAAVQSPATGKRAPACLGKRATVVGTRMNDVLKGTSRADVIAAGRGDDVVRGLGGNDRLCGGDGADDLIGASGNDQLSGADGQDALFGGEGDDALKAEAGNQELLIGGPGNDAIDGGEGFGDVASYLFAPAPVQVNLGAGSATGDGADSLAGIETVRGSEGDDALTGGPASDLLFGGGGNDTISAGDGLDQLNGGSGNDGLDGGPGDDSTSFIASQAGVQVDLAAGTAAGDGADSLTGIEDATGSAFDDVLAGDEGPNSLGGYGGNDQVRGEAGDDFLSGSVVDGGPGTDTCIGGTTTNCERFVVVDGGAGSGIDSPRHGSVVNNTDFYQVTGEASLGLGRPWDSVQAALRRTTSSGCSWWSAKGRRPVAKPCFSPLWTTVDSSGETGPWTYRIRGTLPAGWYEARSRLVFEDGDEADEFFPGFDLVEFQLT